MTTQSNTLGLPHHPVRHCDEMEVAELVGKEILESRLEPGAWALALSECRGEHEEALSAYARIRMRRLKPKRKVQHAKRDCLEQRRMASCLGVDAPTLTSRRSIQDLLQSPNRGKELNFLNPKLSLTWLSILMLGCAGMVATFGRLMADVLPDSVNRGLPMVSIAAALLALAVVLVLRKVLPKPWIMEGWNTGMIATCNLVCLASLFFGAKLVKRSVHESGCLAPSAQQESRVEGKEFDPQLHLVSTELPEVASQP